MKVVVTGAAGGLGRAVCERLLADGADPIGMDVAERPDWAHDFEWHSGKAGDITHGTQLMRVMEQDGGIASIVNLAGMLGTEELWSDIDGAINVNLRGAVNCLKVARIYRVHYIGIETGTFWNTPYSVTKRAARELAQGFHERFGSRTTVLRVMNVYGPFPSLGSKVVPRFFRAALTNQPLPIHGDGSQMLDLVWGGDVATAFERAVLMAPGEGEVIEVGSVPMTVLEFAQEVQDICDVRVGLNMMPERRAEGRLFPAVLDKMRDVLEFEPADRANRLVFDERLAEVRDYYKRALAKEGTRVG